MIKTLIKLKIKENCFDLIMSIYKKKIYRQHLSDKRLHTADKAKILIKKEEIKLSPLVDKMVV